MQKYKRITQHDKIASISGTEVDLTLEKSITKIHYINSLGERNLHDHLIRYSKCNR